MRICLRLRGFNRSQSRRLLLRFRPSHSSPVPAGRPFSGSVAVSVFCFLAWIIFNSSQRSSPLPEWFFHESPVTSHRSFLQRLQLLPINLPIRLDTPGHTHRARLIYQAAILIVSIGEEHHLIHAALILEGDEHHVTVIFCSDVTVSHHPPAQRHALPAQT